MFYNSLLYSPDIHSTKKKKQNILRHVAYCDFMSFGKHTSFTSHGAVGKHTKKKRYHVCNGNRYKNSELTIIEQSLMHYTTCIYIYHSWASWNAFNFLFSRKLMVDWTNCIRELIFNGLFLCVQNSKIYRNVVISMSPCYQMLKFKVLLKSEKDALEHFKSKFNEALSNSWKTSLNWASHNLAKNNT